MTRWYAERRTVLGRWAPQTTREAPHGREIDHPGEVLLRTNSGPVRLRRIMRVSHHLSGRALEELRRLARIGKNADGASRKIEAELGAWCRRRCRPSRCQDGAPSLRRAPATRHEDEQTEADQLLRMMQPEVSIRLLRHNQQIAGAPRDQMDAPEQLPEPAPGAPHGRRCADCFQQIATDGAGHAPTCIYEGQPEAFPRCR